MHTRHIIQRIAHILKRGRGAPFLAPSVAAFRQRLRFLVQSLTEELAGGVYLGGNDSVVIGVAELENQGAVVLVKDTEPR